MKDITKTKLEMAYNYCNDNNKSTAFMLQYMQDYASVDMDCVMNFLEKEIGFKEIS